MIDWLRLVCLPVVYNEVIVKTDSHVRVSWSAHVG